MADINWDEMWNKIREEFESTSASLQELADKYNISGGTLRSRKSREKWEKHSGLEKQSKKKSSSQRCNNSSNTTKKNAAAENKNEKTTHQGDGDSEPKKKHKLPEGGPKGNRKAVTTGEFERIFGDVIDDDEKALARDLELDKLAQVNYELQIITIREHRMMMRIKRLKEVNGDESGLTVVSIETTTGDDKDDTGNNTDNGKNGPTPPGEEPGYQIINITPGMDVFTPNGSQSELQGNIKVKEKKEGILGQILAIEDALTRVQEKKTRLLELKHKIELTRSPDVPDINNYIDALKSTAAEVWSDKNAS
jgi:hypothetical protein